MRRTTRSTATPATAARPTRGAPSEELQEFCRGLRPILVRGDLDGFRRHLRRWEELVGDTAGLAETPDTQTRRTMDALLRRPTQFGLPPWTEDSTSIEAALPLEESGTREPATHPAAAPTVAAPPELPSEAPVSGQAAGEYELTAGEDEAPSDGPPGVFQIDMLSGELVPLHTAPTRTPRPDGATPLSDAPRPRIRRRRPTPAGLEQLSLWSTA